jgi:hypothetical protein
MKISTQTLNLMRHSAGAVITAAAISGHALASDTNHPNSTLTISSESLSRMESNQQNSIAEEPKKEEPKKEEEKKKGGQKDPCEGCGLG